ncbi:unnamed protein product [Rotaria sp. Silwood2]|nr:unnamed protein product [Rotaria sp. Silwood2]CAF2657640.1 unnamed protein product [Rotaria sp. Silwood2]CAF2872537.1 unnamed protein product [Rotaria sp. Silwood2]CAF4236606.1 unnamed protein product [Rotaria sp. Silwood2]CAF4298899.1 unnamed protein product [Rotaria sp. Silwood2]
MGNAAYRRRRAPEIASPNLIQQYSGNSDFIPRSRSLTMTQAPWHVTQWIDPFDPYPKGATVPVLLVIPK